VSGVYVVAEGLSWSYHDDVAYDLNRDVKEPTRYLIYERWKSLADIEAHLKGPYITTLEDGSGNS
jgi:hypothetical protein